MAALPPPESVLHGFGVSAVPERLMGGRGTAWRAGDVVLKPLDMDEEALAWQAEVLPPLAGTSRLRLAPPRRSADGALVVEGWTAWPRLVGSRRPGKWDEIIEAGARFAALSAEVARPRFLDARRDPWARADRIAWQEHPADAVRHVRFVGELLERLERLESPASTAAPSDAPQLIHGDLTGNVLFADDEVPAVIDISPYWRPPSYATGIVLVDALTWEHATRGWAIGHLVDEAHRRSFVRALVFRMLTDHLFDGSNPIADEYRSAVAVARAVTS